MKTLLLRSRARTRASQRGAIAVIVALTAAVLIGFIGLAIDGGHLYLTKTELQNGADACALAASYELTGTPTITVDAFQRADAAGRLVAQKNNVDFQGGAIASGQIVVEFGTALSGGTWLTAASTPPGNAKYVRCTLTRTGIAPYFMQVLGAGAQTAAALATATLAPAQTNCAAPMALCSQGTAPNYGYVVGNWYGLDFQETGGGNNANYTGNFRWIDYDPSSTTPGCPGGGAQELACLIAGPGQCSLPAPISGGCSSSGSANPTPGCVGQNGSINALQAAYNTRFGMYKGSYNIATSPPDFSGFSYDATNWPSQSNAYAGSGGVANFDTARTQHLAVQSSFVPNSFSSATQAQYATLGADRRLVVLPIVDCSSFTGGQHAPVRAYACVMLVNPYDKAGNTVISKLEYRGRSNAPGSPCATSGVAGNSGSQGPMVPALVQ